MSERRESDHKHILNDQIIDLAGQTPRNYILSQEMRDEAEDMLKKSINRENAIRTPKNDQNQSSPSNNVDLYVVATLQKISSEQKQDSEYIKNVATRVSHLAGRLESLELSMNSIPMNAIPALVIKVEQLFGLYETSEKQQQDTKAHLLLIMTKVDKIIDQNNLSLEKALEKKDNELKETKSRIVSILLAAFAALVSILVCIFNLLSKK